MTCLDRDLSRIRNRTLKGPLAERTNGDSKPAPTPPWHCDALTIPAALRSAHNINSRRTGMDHRPLVRSDLYRNRSTSDPQIGVGPSVPPAPNSPVPRV